MRHATPRVNRRLLRGTLDIFHAPDNVLRVQRDRRPEVSRIGLFKWSDATLHHEGG